MGRHPRAMPGGGPRRQPGAPHGLRRRVIANVRSEPAPLSELSRRARRRVPAGGRGWASALALVLAASGMLAIVVVGTSPPSSDRQPGRISSSIPTAQVAFHRTGAATEVSLAGMPRPPAGKTYEVWLLGHAGVPRPLNYMFTVTSAGRAVLELPQSLRGIRAVMLTQEPIGGSRRPTAPPVLELFNPGALAR